MQETWTQGASPETGLMQVRGPRWAVASPPPLGEGWGERERRFPFN